MALRELVDGAGRASRAGLLVGGAGCAGRLGLGVLVDGAGCAGRWGLGGLQGLFLIKQFSIIAFSTNTCFVLQDFKPQKFNLPSQTSKFFEVIKI